jgi:hypothetical protein
LTEPPPFDDADLFDEAGYLRLYPGIATALMQGLIDTARNHYVHHGRQEGRRPNDVDADFYLAAYPAIERDFGHPPSRDEAARHFVALGRARGYRPNAQAPRMANAAAMVTPFGGFWVDQADALDLIQGRVDLGEIRLRDAAMLRAFALDGIAAFDRGADQDQVRDAALIVDQAFTGMFPALLVRSGTQEAAPQQWRPELTEQNVAALDLHMFSRAVRALLLDKAVTDFLSLIFGSHPKLTASMAFLRESATQERDVAHLAHTLPLRFAAVTFALDSGEGAPVSVWPGSHRLPDLLWGGEHVSLPDARRANVMDLEQAIARRETTVRALWSGLEPRRLEQPAGARMIRHANLIYAVDAPEPPNRRRSLTAWYCPSHVEPAYMETTRAAIHQHDGIRFSSGVYPALDPLD